MKYSGHRVRDGSEALFWQLAAAGLKRQDPGMTRSGLPSRLLPLVEQLRRLPAEQRAKVIRAATDADRPDEHANQGRAAIGAPELTPVPWDELLSMTGMVELGGDAVADCNALYDDV
jgi:hypothetical protein